MKNQKFKTRAMMEHDLKRTQWRNMQVMICGWCFIAMVIMIIISAICSFLNVEGF